MIKFWLNKRAFWHFDEWIDSDFVDLLTINLRHVLWFSKGKMTNHNKKIKVEIDLLNRGYKI